MHEFEPSCQKLEVCVKIMDIMEKERISIITWKDVIKLALGIMIGLTPAIYIMKYSAEVEIKSASDNYVSYEYVPTIYDMLEEREDMIHALWVDSVYYAIPESVLIQILVDKGTKLSHIAIVEEYLKNKGKK